MTIGNTEKRSRNVRTEEKKLLVRLRSEDEHERIEATGKLWDLWFAEKGRSAEDRLREVLVEGGWLV